MPTTTNSVYTEPNSGSLLETQASKAAFRRDYLLARFLSCHYRTSVMLMIYKHRIKEICNMCQTWRGSSDLAGLATESQNIKRYLFRLGHLCRRVYRQINVCKRSFYHTRLHTVHTGTQITHFPNRIFYRCVELLGCWNKHFVGSWIWPTTLI